MILVTGGTGFIGRRLVEDLLSCGRRVRILTRATPPGLPNTVEVCEGSLLEPASLVRALDGVQIVVHLAASFTSDQVFHVNVKGTRSLAEVGARTGVRRVVHISSAGVYGEGSCSQPHREDDTPDPVTPYQRSKLAAEHALRETLGPTDVKWIILRPTDVFGPTSLSTVALFRRVVHRQFWLHGPCHSLMQPVYVGDVVTAILRTLAADAPAGSVLNIGGPSAIDYADWIALIGKSLGRTPRQLRLPRASGLAARISADLLMRTGLRPPYRLTRFGRPVANRAVDVTRAKRLIDYVPSPLAVSIQKTADALWETVGLREAK